MSVSRLSVTSPMRLLVPRRGRLKLAALLLAVLAIATSGTPVAAWSPSSYSPADESQLFSLTNQARASAGLPALRNDSYLVGLARWRSKDMIDRNYFSHNIPPSGEMVFAVMSRQGYCFKLAGENIGVSTFPDDQATSMIEQAFLNSPGHRANIMGKTWDVMGVGAYKGSSGKKMYTVLFADKCGSTTPPKATPKPTPKPAPRVTAAPARKTQTPVARPTARPTVPAATTMPTVPPTASPLPTLVPTATPEPTEPSPTATAAATPEPTPSPSTTGDSQAATLRVRQPAPAEGLLGSVFQALFGGLIGR